MMTYPQTGAHIDADISRVVRFCEPAGSFVAFLICRLAFIH
ncbi:Uncharacterised protein [Plesiomonas shigelloides]|nr:Uncharacterised protein [Plesiomonas shigelloides]